MATLVIKGKAVQLKRIKVEGIQLDKDAKTGKKDRYVNAKGEELVKQQVSKSEYKWINTQTMQQETKPKGVGRWPYKSFKGKPISAFKQTKEVEQVEVVDFGRMCSMIENEATYLVCNPEFKAQMKEIAEKENAGWAFKYVNSGFKIYKAVVYYDAELDRVLMRCFRGNLTAQDLDENTESEEVKASEEQVETLDLASIEV